MGVARTLQRAARKSIRALDVTRHGASRPWPQACSGSASYCCTERRRGTAANKLRVYSWRGRCSTSALSPCSTMTRLHLPLREQTPRSQSLEGR